MTEAATSGLKSPSIQVFIETGPLSTGQRALTLETNHKGGRQPFNFPPDIRAALEQLIASDPLVANPYFAPSGLMLELKRGTVQAEVWPLRDKLVAVFREGPCLLDYTSTTDWALLQRLTVEPYPSLSAPHAVMLEVAGATVFPLSLSTARAALRGLADGPTLLLVDAGRRLIFSPHSLSSDELEEALRRIRAAVMFPPSSTNYTFVHDQRPVPTAS